MSEPASDLSKRVAIELRNARNRSDWTWEQIQDRTGITARTMKRMLAGQVDIPVSRLLLICAAAGIDPADLMDEVARHMPPGHIDSLLTTSERSATVTPMRPDTDWDAYQGWKVANNDVEAEHDEPDPA